MSRNLASKYLVFKVFPLPLIYEELYKGGYIMGITRKDFLVGLGAVAAGASIPSLVLSKTRGKRITSLKNIKPLKPISFAYPDADSPTVLIDMGEPVYLGVGLNRSIVAFSVLCQHMGCPSSFDPERKLIVCPCHGSLFDPARGGMCVEGPAISRLPMIALEVKKGNVYAVGVAYGLIYGRARNF